MKRILAQTYHCESLAKRSLTRGNTSCGNTCSCSCSSSTNTKSVVSCIMVIAVAVVAILVAVVCGFSNLLGWHVAKQH